MDTEQHARRQHYLRQEVQQRAIPEGEEEAYTDKKENKIFFIYKEIHNGAVAKSYMTYDLLIYREIFTHFLIYEEALPQI